MRGGNICNGLQSRPSRGLSPHARGKLVIRSASAFSCGPIPACAGETKSWCGVAAFARAYPRMRGGNGFRAVRFADLGGLSPHARGKLRGLCQQAQAAGPIPACAGETLPRSSFPACAGAYPRMRGGNFSVMPWAALMAGLSPHARGKRVSPDAKDTLSGPIPACAGETRKPGRPKRV